MSFAQDKLYDGYLRTNMPTIVSTVKVREIMVHLPCLTSHDRETIEAKREMCGNFNGMVLLLDCLKRRESWPEHFIRALEKCEHTTIAAEVRAEYDKLRGAGDSTPSSPPTTVVKAHVHPAPSAAHLPGPESSGPSQAAASPPSPPQVHAEPEAVPTPAAPEPPLATSAPETPPSPSPPPQAADRDHPEPEENSECAVEDAQAMTPEEVSFNCESAQATAASDVIESLPESPVDLDVAPSTPERAPVQETAPPVEEVTPVTAVTPPAEDMSEAPPPQTVIENCTETGSAPASPVEPAAPDPPSVCLSTPRKLTSVLPQDDPNSDAAGSGSSLEPPYSGDTDRLEISKDDDDDEDETRVNVVHVSQQPSALNLDGQRVVNGAAAAVQEPASPTVCPDEPEKPAPRGMLGANAKLMATAVGVGACALLLAWKLKH
ncbi:mitochondrial antiviral-signaling protein [Festucalex cinctus]